MRVLRGLAVLFLGFILCGCTRDSDALTGEWIGTAPSGAKVVMYFGKDGTAKLTMGNRAFDSQMFPGTTMTWTQNSSSSPKELDFKASSESEHVVIPMIYNKLANDRVAVRMGHIAVLEQQQPTRPSWQEGDPSVFIDLILDRKAP